VTLSSATTTVSWGGTAVDTIGWNGTSGKCEAAFTNVYPVYSGNARLPFQFQLATSSGRTYSSSIVWLWPTPYRVMAELLYDGSDYYVAAWLEDTRLGTILSLTDGNSNLSYEIRTASGSQVGGTYGTGATPDADGVYRSNQWNPSPVTSSFFGTVTITYLGRDYVRDFVFTPVLGEGLSTIGADIQSVGSQLTDVEIKVDNLQTDITNIGGDTDELLDRVGDPGASDLWTRISEIRTEIVKANWDDIEVMSKANVNWSDIRVMTISTIDWADLAEMTQRTSIGRGSRPCRIRKSTGPAFKL
jgi:hypothetical protein